MEILNKDSVIKSNYQLGYQDKRRYWTCNVREKMDINIGESWPSSLKPITVMEQFKSTMYKHGSHCAFKFKKNGMWHGISWKNYYELTRQFAKSLISVGLDEFHGVTIQGFNSPEWIIANMGSIFAKGIPAGIYPTNGIESTQ